MDEVDQATQLLEEASKDSRCKKKGLDLMVVKMYGSLSPKEQMRVFFHTPSGFRKVVVATNVAETSVTIPGIVHG